MVDTRTQTIETDIDLANQKITPPEPQVIQPYETSGLPEIAMAHEVDTLLKNAAKEQIEPLKKIRGEFSDEQVGQLNQTASLLQISLAKESQLAPATTTRVQLAEKLNGLRLLVKEKPKDKTLEALIFNIERQLGLTPGGSCAKIEADFITTEANLDEEEKASVNTFIGPEEGKIRFDQIVGRHSQKPEAVLEERNRLIATFPVEKHPVLSKLLDKILVNNDIRNHLNYAFFGYGTPQEFDQAFNQAWTEIVGEQPQRKSFFEKIPKVLWQNKWAILLMLALQGPGLLASLLPEDLSRGGR